MKRTLNRILRRLVPSTVLLSQSRPFAGISRVVDALVRPSFRLFTSQPIPPLRLMVRVGVGNRILFPHYHYLTYSIPLWLYFFRKGFATLDSQIVEIGSGVGRAVVALRDYNYEAGEKFRGTYTGFDIDAEMVHWCQEHFPDSFEFTLLDMHSTVYNPHGSAGNKPRLGCEDDSVDLVYSRSLFTHLLEEDVHHYINESYRILMPGKVMSMSFFCMDDLERMQVLRGGRWAFRHRIGNAYVENTRSPESAVAYRKEWILEVARECGFSHLSVVPGNPQSLLEGVKQS